MKIQKEIREEIKDNVSYDINGVYDNSFEEENRLITDINILINDKSDRLKRIKKDILINIINHYIHQYYDELDYRVFKKIEQNK